MSLYQCKRLLLYPRTIYMRHKYRELTGFMHNALEVHYYRPAFFQFIGATMNCPDLLHDATLDADSVVFDVGGFIGDWSLKIAERYGPKIYTFEPNPRNLNPLRKNCASYDNIEILPYGLGATNQTVPMFSKGMGSSIYRFRDGAAAKEVVDISIRDVTEVIDELNIDGINLLKINIEGGEYDLLDRMIETGLIDRVGCLLVQYHEWLPHAYRRRRRINKTLRDTHECVWDYPFVWEKWQHRGGGTATT